MRRAINRAANLDPRQAVRLSRRRSPPPPFPDVRHFLPWAFGTTLSLFSSANADQVNQLAAINGPDIDADQHSPLVPCHPPLQAETTGPTPGDAVSINRIEIYCNLPNATAPSQPGRRSALNTTTDGSNGANLDATWAAAQLASILEQPVGIERLIDRVLAVNAIYLENGYINSGLRLSDRSALANGAARLDLIFGRLSTGPLPSGEPAIGWADNNPAGLTPNFLVKRLPSLAAQPFNSLQLESDFSLLTEEPAIMRVTGALSPGLQPGVAHLQLEAAPEERFDAYLTASNSRAASVGGERIAMGGSVRNTLIGGDLLSIEVGQTEGLSDAAASYSSPFFSPRTSLGLEGTINDANVVEPALRDLDIKSEGWSLSGGLTHNLVQNPVGLRSGGRGRPGRIVAVGASLLHNVSETSLLGEPFSFSPGSVDGHSQLTALRLGGDWLERSADKIWTARLETTIGLDGTAAGLEGLTSPDENFANARLQLTHARRITRNTELRGRVLAQWADGVMYTSERLYVGGMRSVRGYSENLVLADSGLIGSVELMRNFNFTDVRSGFNWGDFRAGVFVDAAAVRNNAPVDRRSTTLSSLGASLHWSPSPALSAELAYGHAFSNPTGDNFRDRDNAWHVQVTVRPFKF